MRILVAEDEIRLAESLCQLLRDEGYRPDAAYTGPEGLELARTGQYSAIVLDVMLPGLDGFQVCSSLREAGVDTPILMLTALSGVADKVNGLDCGADDYMTKPFAPEELLARIRALTRRQGETPPSELIFADLRLDTSTHTLSRDERSVRLSPKEFELLKLLMSTSGVVPKSAIISRVWGAASDAEDNNVEAYISFLRKKFFYLGSTVGISTLRKVGYRLEDSGTGA